MMSRTLEVEEPQRAEALLQGGLNILMLIVDISDARSWDRQASCCHQGLQAA